jgi:hypothetical protein
VPDASLPPPARLSLPARLCLLAWDTTGSRSTRAAHLPRLVRAGALTELAQRGLLVDDEGIVTPADLDTRTGDAALDGLLDLVRESRPRRWESWVTPWARLTLAAVRGQLTVDGYLRAEKRRALGVLPTVQHVLECVRAVDALRDQARQVLEGPVPVGEVAERDAAVVALAVAAGLCTPASGADRGHQVRRIEELTERGGAGGPGLREVVREIRTAVNGTARADSAPAAG